MSGGRLGRARPHHQPARPQRRELRLALLRRHRAASAAFHRSTSTCARACIRRPARPYAVLHLQSYRRGRAGDGCAMGSSSISGLAFYQNGNYPAVYRDALFFADYSRNCIWTMFPVCTGEPDPVDARDFCGRRPVSARRSADRPQRRSLLRNFNAGDVRRMQATGNSQPPLAVLQPTRPTARCRSTVQFNGARSSDPEGGGAHLRVGPRSAMGSTTTRRPWRPATCTTPPASSRCGCGSPIRRALSAMARRRSRPAIRADGDDHDPRRARRPVERRRCHLVLGTADRRPGRRARAGGADMVGDHPPLLRRTVISIRCRASCRRVGLVQRARSRVSVVPRAAAHGDGLQGAQQHDQRPPLSQHGDAELRLESGIRIVADGRQPDGDHAVRGDRDRRLRDRGQRGVAARTGRNDLSVRFVVGWRCAHARVRGAELRCAICRDLRTGAGRRLRRRPARPGRGM